MIHDDRLSESVLYDQVRHPLIIIIIGYIDLVPPKEDSRSFSKNVPMIAFVTVGSTKFDALVEAAISEPVLSALRNLGYTRLILQRGNSVIEKPDRESSYSIQRHGVDIEIWKFKPSIQAELEQADLIISHAGELFAFLEQVVN